MELSKRCFKVDKPNAKAMILGFMKNGRLYYQSIWLAVSDGSFPALLTLQRVNTKFKVSNIGRAMKSDDFTISHKYAVWLDCEYFIRNEISLWQTLCSNGIFDIWEPEQPYIRFLQAKSSPRKFRIQLLRIYEIEREFNHQDIRYASDRVDQIVSPTREITIKRPVMSDAEFNVLKDLLESSVASYLIQPPLQHHPMATIALSDAILDEDIDSLNLENEFFEGEKKPRLSSFYERNPRLRAAAISYHGTICKICGFDFEKMYGERGHGFIEIHHLTPVSSLSSARLVDPRSELIAVCSNCHRMLHRKKENLITPEQLLEVIHSRLNG